MLFLHTVSLFPVGSFSSMSISVCPPLHLFSLIVWSKLNIRQLQPIRQRFDLFPDLILHCQPSVSIVAEPPVPFKFNSLASLRLSLPLEQICVVNVERNVPTLPQRIHQSRLHHTADMVSPCLIARPHRILAKKQFLHCIENFRALVFPRREIPH